MSGCQKYIQLGSKAERLEDLPLVAQVIAKDLKERFSEVYIHGSRWRGGWRYCSDFDFAVSPLLPSEVHALQDEYSNKYGVKIEFRDSAYFRANESQGLKL